jgi:hypothetical protein
MAMAGHGAWEEQQLVGKRYERSVREWRKEWGVKNESKERRGWPAMRFYRGREWWQLFT